MTDKKSLPVREPQALTAGKVIRTAEGARRWGKPIGAVLDGTGGSKSSGSAAPKARAKIGVKIGFKPEQRQAIKVTKRVSTIEPKKSKPSLTKKSLPSKSSSDGSKVKVSLLNRIRDKRLAKAQNKANAKKAQNAPRPGYAESLKNARLAHNAEAARKFSDPKNKGRKEFEANAARERALSEASAKKFKQLKAKEDAIRDAKAGVMTDYEKRDRARRGADKVSKSTAAHANRQYGSKSVYGNQQQRGRKSGPQFASKFDEMHQQAAQRQKSIAKAANQANAQNQNLISKNKRKLQR